MKNGTGRLVEFHGKAGKRVRMGGEDFMFKENPEFGGRLIQRVLNDKAIVHFQRYMPPRSESFSFATDLESDEFVETVIESLEANPQAVARLRQLLNETDTAEAKPVKRAKKAAAKKAE